MVVALAVGDVDRRSVCSDLVAELGVLLLALLAGPHLEPERSRVCVPGLIGRSETLISSSTSGFSPESQIELPSRRTSARRRMKSGAPFQRSVAPSFDA